MIQTVLNISNFKFYIPNIQFKANFVVNKIDSSQSNYVYSENEPNITSEKNTEVNEDRERKAKNMHR